MSMLPNIISRTYIILCWYLSCFMIICLQYYQSSILGRSTSCLSRDQHYTYRYSYKDTRLEWPTRLQPCEWPAWECWLSGSSICWRQNCPTSVDYRRSVQDCWWPRACTRRWHTPSCTIKWPLMNNISIHSESDVFGSLYWCCLLLTCSTVCIRISWPLMNWNWFHKESGIQDISILTFAFD